MIGYIAKNGQDIVEEKTGQVKSLGRRYGRLAHFAAFDTLKAALAGLFAEEAAAKGGQAGTISSCWMGLGKVKHTRRLDSRGPSFVEGVAAGIAFARGMISPGPGAGIHSYSRTGGG